MRNRWNARAVRSRDPLAELVARSRLIGEEASLGLFGGGNTSLKGAAPDFTGRPRPVLWVKGSGCDLKGCGPHQFSALRLAELQQLLARTSMTDDEMVACLEQCLLDPRRPRPSIETLLHAFIPEAAIDHTHADAILALANTDQGQALTRDALGPKLLWIPYLQPGFILSRRVAEAYRRDPSSHGAILEKHGLITWGPDSRASYGRTIRYVTAAERFIARRPAASRRAPAHTTLPSTARLELLRRWLPVIRRTISAGRKLHLQYVDSPDVLAFVNAARLPQLARVGPATPDHLLRTKRFPCLLTAPGRRAVESLSSRQIAAQLERYAREHRRYVRVHQAGPPPPPPLNPYPRVILIPGVGMLTAGKDAADTGKVAEIYRHTIAIIRAASAVGRYTSVSEKQAFAVEYWPLELYKLSLAPKEAELAGQICLVTGATGGIGRAIARHLVGRGASVVATDLDPRAVEALAQELNAQAKAPRALGVAMDVTDEAGIRRALDAVLTRFGGLDVLVSNAGIAAVASIERLSRLEWDRSFAVNATGHFLVAQQVIRLLRAQGLGGALVFVASKNVLAPGKEFGAYSAAKAAETQLARVLAIENGEAGIRVNIVNPDGVFDGSGLWKTIGLSRAKTYRLAPGQLEDYYRKRNLMQVRVLPDDVAGAVGFLASPASSKTTGCILTVDGGVREAFPR